jgi:WD40 repeat protein/serine/threonine protein kinase/DNA-binding XRE family transcriptional regulator
MEELSFGNSVRKRRRELDLTQEELARRVGCAAITIRKIEAEDARPSVQIAERLAMALAIPLELRAEFVRRARSIRPESEERYTPLPNLEEIGLDNLTGRAVHGYALSEKIGSGSMGVVYRAVQPVVEREVAVKIILPGFANHPNFIRRFETEAKLVARLEHPHIVPLYDYWREPGLAFLIMRLLRGGSLEGLLRDGPLPVDMTARILEQVCFALYAAHRIGVIHRDLKPANVFLDEDQNAYLGDFGIAKNLEDSDLSDQTNAGIIIGTPAYMSPEQIRSLVVQPQTDIYCLGIMLYEMLTGAVPFNGSTPFDLIQQHIYAPMLPLAAHRKGLPATLDAVVCHATAKEPGDRYESVIALLEDFQQAVSGMATRPLSIYNDETLSVEITNPYKGLRAFSEADAEDFFGREILVQQLLARMSEGGELTRFLAVIGPSGSGKSSVVKAGLIPALKRGGLLGSENWFYLDIIPGPNPFEELEAALLRVAVNPPNSLLDQLKSGNNGFVRTINRILPPDQGVELVLVIDQFEELFTMVKNEAERALFLNNLVVACLDERSRVRVIINLRADFTDRPLRYIDFGELVQQRNELVMPLTPEEVERAIAGPARRVGLRLEPGIISVILHDLGDQPGTLPLLQYALTELFEQREGNLITKAAYQSIGGVFGALERQAEEIFTKLGENEQALARQMFLRLVTPGEGTEDTRRRVLQTELIDLVIDNHQLASGSHYDQLVKIMEDFGRSRLLSFDHDPVSRTPTVEVAHEALIREWARLRKWLLENREDVRIERQLATIAADWQFADCDASYLLTGARLTQIESWAESTTIALTQEEHTFLDASITEKQRIEAEERARQQREIEVINKLAESERFSAMRLRRRNRVITAVGSVAVFLAILAAIFGFRSDQNAQQAQANYIHAEAQRLAAEATNAYNANASAELVALLSIRALNLQYSPQGDTALLNAAQLNYPERLYTQEEPLFSALISPDSRSMLVISTEGTTERVVDIHSGQQLQQFLLPDAAISAAFSPDGQFILTNGADDVQRLWDVKTGREVQHFPAGGQITFGGFSADGKDIYVGEKNEKNLLYRWEALTGKEERHWQFPGSPRGVSPDGHYAITYISDDPTTQVWDLDTGDLLHTLDPSELPTDMQFCAGGALLVIGYFDGTARIWDPVSANLLQTLQGHDGTVRKFSCSPDGKFVLTGSDDRTARLWDVQSGQELNRFRDQALITSVALAANGQYVTTLSGDGAGDTVRIWAAQPRHEWPNLPEHQDAINGVAIDTPGRLLATGDAAGAIRLWDVRSGQMIRQFSTDDTINFGLQFSPDGRYLASGQWHSGIVQLWDVQTGQEVQRYTTGDTGSLNDLAFSPDGRFLFGGGGNFIDQEKANAVLWDVQTGKPVFKISLQESGPFYGVDYSPDGKYLLTAHIDGAARLWDSRTGKQVKEYNPHQEGLVSAKFSPDGTKILTTGFEGRARLWDVQTGQEVREFVGHTDLIAHTAFSHDGVYAATASFDGTVRLWQVSTGRELRRYTGHLAGVENVAFSPDGTFLVSVSDDGTARFWDTDYHVTVQYLCKRLQRDLTSMEKQEFGITDISPTCSVQ